MQFLVFKYFCKYFLYQNTTFPSIWYHNTTN